MIEERKAYIDDSLMMAEKARIELQQVKVEGNKIIADARKEHQAILVEAAQLREKLVKDAHAQAMLETEQVTADARLLIQHEKEMALKEIRLQVADLSVNIAEKIVRNQLSNSTEQQKMIQRLLDEISVPKS